MQGEERTATPALETLPIIHLNRFLEALSRIHWLGPGVVFAAAFFLYVLIPGAWSFLHGNLVEHDGVDPFLGARNSYVFAIPFVLAAIHSYFRNTRNLLEELLFSGVLQVPHSVLQQTILSVRSSAWSRSLSGLFAMSAILTPLLFLLNSKHPAPVTWLFSSPSTPRPLAFYFVFLFHGLAIYIVLGWLLMHLRAAAVLRQVFGENTACHIDLFVLHPDGSMGLGAISRMVKSASLVLVSLSFLFFMWQLGVFYSFVVQNNNLTAASGLMEEFRRLQGGNVGGHGLPLLGMLAAWFGYCFFSPLVFFAPLSSAQKRMASLKHQELLSLGLEIMKVQGKRYRKSRVGGGGMMDGQCINDVDSSKRLKFLAEQYQLIERARVWPFDLRTLASFIATLGGPLLITLLSDVVKDLLLK